MENEQKSMNKTIENLKKLKSFHNGSYGADIDKAIKALEQEPKTGYWIVEDSGNYNGKWSTCYCSNCKDYYTRNWREMNYCPNCGAKMESEDKE